MSVFRLTPRARRSLVSLFKWTIARFGAAHADRYRQALTQRCQALADGRPPHGRPCDVLLRGHANASGLLYYREGAHYIIFTKDDDGIVVIDFVHERRDPPKLIDRIARSSP